MRAVYFDPYQMQATAQRLRASGVPIGRVPAVRANLTAASQNLYELIKGRGLVVYPDDAMRLAVIAPSLSRPTRGWRIAKEKTSHKIDIVVAMAMAAYAAVQKGEAPQIRIGFCSAGVGPVKWRDPQANEPLRVTVRHVTEHEDLKERGLM